MDVVMIYFYSKRFRFAPSFNKIKGELEFGTLIVPALLLFPIEHFPVSRSKQRHFKFKPVCNSVYSKYNIAHAQYYIIDNSKSILSRFIHANST